MNNKQKISVTADTQTVVAENDVINSYDVVVVGGGMVGAAVALGLAQAGWSVAVIEHQAPTQFVENSPPDVRVSAIGCAAVKLFKRLNAWDAVVQMRVTPYRHLETWEWPESKVEFNAADLGLTELGYMVENNLLQLGLWQQFAGQPRLELFSPTALHTMQRNGSEWTLTLTDGRRLAAPLVIGADGANSRVRQLVGIGITGWQYRQSCMLITIKSDQPQQDTTWQQFTPTGPRAFLPLFEPWGCLVWYDSPTRIKELQEMSLVKLNQELHNEFPQRLGKVEVTATGSFPLIRRHAQRYYKQGVVLLGDAAHTINPLAGQGVNLGYRDVEVLLAVLVAAKAQGEEFASDQVLVRYQRRRMPDNLLMQAGMDFFYKGFSNQIMPLQVVRNLALMAAQRSGKLKDWLLKYALGL